ncbi:MAG TPA: SWIM zinc finger family protein [Symbiobacteriaceae bacterium]|jgi:uncharacterized Zn finger protein
MGGQPPFGATWAGKRFLAWLESFGWESRLERGRTYALAGKVLDLRVGPGVVEARVQGSRPRPYRVQIHVEPLESKDWRRVVTALAKRPDLAAALRAGEMPPDVEYLFSAARAPLFPEDDESLGGACSCPDQAFPCKHMAAVGYRFAAELDADPQLLIDLRGLDRNLLLQDLHMRLASRGDVEYPVAGVADPDRFWTAGPAAETLAFRFDPPEQSGAVVAQLGALPGAAGGVQIAAELTFYYQIAGACAGALARQCGLTTESRDT